MRLKQFEGVGGMRDQFQIDPRRLKVRPDFNIRDLTTPAAREKLDILKAQIKAEGVLEALEIEWDGEAPWINEGHRRHVVVMELIEEGHEFKTIPCIQERANTNEGKRALHMLMRKKEDYEPLEYAKGIDRLVHVYGWDRGKLAKVLGCTKQTIDNYLKTEELPEPTKEHVRQGNVSATTARNLAQSDLTPEEQDELIRKNKEENAKIKGKGKSHKVTAKTLKRDKPKPKPEPKVNPDLSAGPESVVVSFFETTASGRQEPHAEIKDAAEDVHTQATAMVAAASEPLPPVSGDGVDETRVSEERDSDIARIAPQRSGIKDLIEAIEPIAKAVQDFDPECPDETVFFISDRGHELNAGQCRAAWRAWNAATGGSEVKAA